MWIIAWSMSVREWTGGMSRGKGWHCDRVVHGGECHCVWIARLRVWMEEWVGMDVCVRESCS